MPEPRDLPLFHWGAELRRARMARRRLLVRLGLGSTALGGLILVIADPPLPRLLWNVSASAPKGLYWVTPGTSLRVGDMAAARLSETWGPLAEARGYIPARVPLVKQVAATQGQRVCAIGETLSVDGQSVATRLAEDARRRKLPWWTGCRRLRDGECFLLMEGNPSSFDGRYWGVTGREDIIGRARLLWRR